MRHSPITCACSLGEKLPLGAACLCALDMTPSRSFRIYDLSPDAFWAARLLGRDYSSSSRSSTCIRGAGPSQLTRFSRPSDLGCVRSSVAIREAASAPALRLKSRLLGIIASQHPPFHLPILVFSASSGCARIDANDPYAKKAVRDRNTRGWHLINNSICQGTEGITALVSASCNTL